MFKLQKAVELSSDPDEDLEFHTVQNGKILAPASALALPTPPSKHSEVLILYLNFLKTNWMWLKIYPLYIYSDAWYYIHVHVHYQQPKF